MIPHCVKPHSAKRSATRPGRTPQGGRHPAHHRLRRRRLDRGVRGQRRTGHRRTTRCRLPRRDLSRPRLRCPKPSGSGISQPRARPRHHRRRAPPPRAARDRRCREQLSRELSLRMALRARTRRVTRRRLRRQRPGAPLPVPSTPHCPRQAVLRQAVLQRFRRTDHRRATVPRKVFRVSRLLAPSRVSACRPGSDSKATGSRVMDNRARANKARDSKARGNLATDSSRDSAPPA